MGKSVHQNTITIHSDRYCTKLFTLEVTCPLLEVLGHLLPKSFPRLVTRVLSLTRGRERTLGMRLRFHFPAEVEVRKKKRKKEKDVKILNFNMLRNISRLKAAVDPSSFFFHLIFKGYPSALQTVSNKFGFLDWESEANC